MKKSKDGDLIEPGLILVITNRKGVMGDKTWCIEKTRIPLYIIAQVLDEGGTKQLFDWYPQLKKSKCIEVLK